MGICSFGQNKVVRYPVDHKYTSVPLCSLSMVSPPCIDGRWFPQGWFAPYYRSGGTGSRKNVHFAGLQRCSDALFAISYTVFLLHVWVVCFPQHCSLLFDLTCTTNFVLRSLQCLIPALRRKRKLDVDQGLWLRGEKKLWGYFGFLRNTDLSC